jgi:RimJ/RimL family protein N-acetyltransferase
MLIETDRLILRPWEDRDHAPLAAIQGDPTVRRYFPALMTPEAVTTDIALHTARKAEFGYGFQAAELKETGELVGLVGIGRVPDATRAAIPSHPEVETGWVFAQKFWGQGLAPEAASAWLDAAWSLGLPEIVAFTAAINIPSQRVMEKIGMARDPSDDFDHPKIAQGHPLRPHVVYRIVRP